MSAKTLSAVEFAEAIITHWPPFRWDEHQETSWTQALVREVSGFDKEVLANAMAHMVRTRRDTKTPTVAMCIDACVAERRYIEAQKRVESLPDAQQDAGKFPAYSPQRTELANTLVKSPIGRQAAKEGWIGAMYAFAVEHGRLPLANAHVPEPKPGPHPHRRGKYIGMTEIEMCKKQAKDFDETYALCVRGETATARQWESVGAAMLKQRKELANMVLEAR